MGARIFLTKGHVGQEARHALFYQVSRLLTLDGPCLLDIQDALSPNSRKFSGVKRGQQARPRPYCRLELRSFCRKTHVHKTPRFRGYFGVFWGLGGGEVPILFLWARGFF